MCRFAFFFPLCLLRRIGVVLSAAALLAGPGVGGAAPATPPTPLKVMVLKDSPHMSYRDGQGRLVGFNADMARLLCETIKAACEIIETHLSLVVDQVSRGEADFTTASLLPTPERQKKVSFTIPVRWSRSFVVSTKPVATSTAPWRVAVVEGSRQHAWAEKVKAERRWTLVPVAVNAGLEEALSSGRAMAVVVPFTTAVGIVQDSRLGQDGSLSVDPITDPELSLPTVIAVDPTQSDLLNLLNNAIREVQSNGRLEILNSKYFPLRML